MKKIKTIFLLTSIFAALIFTGCNNSVSVPYNDNSENNNNEQGYSLKGGISFNINALLSELSGNTSSARMASPYLEDITNLEIDCNSSTVTGLNSRSGYKIKGSIAQDEDEDYFYTIYLPFAGEWEIQLVVKTSTMTFCGNCNVTIINDNGQLNYVGFAPEIGLVPVISKNQTGTINLGIGNDVISNDGSNYSVVWTWEQKPEDVKENPSTYNFQDEDYIEISFDNIPSGSYKVNIAFKKDETTLYSCDQWIHVFGGMETDTWYGSGPQYINNNFVLTQQAVSLYKKLQLGTYSEKTVLYKKNTAEECDIQIIDQNNYSTDFSAISVPDVILPEPLVAYGNSLTNTYCYGKDNTIYVAGEVMDDEYYNMYHYIYEIQQDGTTTQYYLFEDPDDKSDYKYESTITAIDYDENNGHIFIINEGKEILQNNDYVYFHKLFEVELDSDSNTAVLQKIYKIGQKNQQINTFLINDGLLYLSEYRNNCIFLDMYLIDSENNTLTQFYSKKLLDLSESKYKTNNIENHIVLINDLVYINNSLYILMSDYYTNLYYSYCRGGVIKYDTFAQTCEDIAGFATTDNFNSIPKVNFLCSENNTSENKIYTNGTIPHNDDDLYYLEISTQNYGPVNDNLEFYGPKKIISYNDSYLYITDSGIKILLDNENITSFENINRIAKFNIEDMEIEEIVSGVDSEVKFELEKDKVFTSGTEGYTLGETVVYDEGGNLLTGSNTKIYPYILKHQD